MVLSKLWHSLAFKYIILVPGSLQLRATLFNLELYFPSQAYSTAALSHGKEPKLTLDFIALTSVNQQILFLPYLLALH